MNIQLSKRLQQSADLVSKGAKVADIGCDHAYTSIYLMEQGIAKKVIAMDINKGPLAIARENIDKAGLSKTIHTRLSDGMEMLEHGEVDSVLIGGMGGPLMVRILSKRKDLLPELQELILQPQSEIDVVRHFLHDNGFTICKEAMVLEEDKYYVSMRAVHGQEKYEREEEYMYGRYLLQKKDSVLETFLQKEWDKRQAVIHNLERQKESMKAIDRIEELKIECERIQNCQW